jgi:uncharacterized RDD family membrane protein YckC
MTIDPRSSLSQFPPPTFEAIPRTDGVLLRRALAYLLDLVFMGVVSAVIALPLMMLTVLSFGLIHFYMIAAFVPLLYGTLLIGGRASATWGMRLMDIGYRRLDGGRPSHVEAFLVTLLFYVSIGLTIWLILLVPLLSARRRTLHDMICGLLMARRAGNSWIF